MPKTDYDAVVVGSGPNGLAAAITLQREGLSVLLIEGRSTIGGGMRTEEFTLPGFRHDVCSAIHPLAVGSPFFRSLPLQEFGLEFIVPPISAAHPLDSGAVGLLVGDVEVTAKALGEDGNAYRRLFHPIVSGWPALETEVLSPLHLPKNPLQLASFGFKALSSAATLSERFRTKEARALLSGMAAHSMLPLNQFGTSSIALVLMTLGHLYGWPMPMGGADSIADALGAYFEALGGKIETDSPISSFSQLPSAKAILLDLTPWQLLELAPDGWSRRYAHQLRSYEYGMGIFKIDWALDAPIPFASESCRSAGTVHIGGTFEEVAYAEAETAKGRLPEKPFVLLAQQSLFDPTRAPDGKHTAWAYCHVPNGCQVDRTEAIENQVERFAPGFKERILGRHTMNALEMEIYNPNYIGGDIGGGSMKLSQLFTRPGLRVSPYRTSERGLISVLLPLLREEGCMGCVDTMRPAGF